MVMWCWVLQWSRTVSGAETFEHDPLGRGGRFASMEPHRFWCGDQFSTSNEIAPSVLQWSRTVSGAETGVTWLYLSGNQLLQWSRTVSGAETSPM